MSRRDEETLLIVEANPTIRRSLATYLKSDYRVIGEKPGAEAWSTLVRKKSISSCSTRA